MGRNEPNLQNGARTIAQRRPTPEKVADIAEALAQTKDPLKVSILVKALRHETNCSRATAYRAVADAIAAGTVTRGTR